MCSVRRTSVYQFCCCCIECRRWQNVNVLIFRLKNHKTNYKLTLLPRRLVCFLNLVMCFAVSPWYPHIHTCELWMWAHNGPRRNVTTRETFATNGKDNRNICGRASSRDGGVAETHSRCKFHFSLVKTKKEAIKDFITFSSSWLECLCVRIWRRCWIDRILNFHQGNIRSFPF